MSWFTSLFSSIKFPPPADSIRPNHPSQHQQQHPHQKRLLEEPPLPSSTQSPSPTHEETQAAGRRRNKLIFFAGLAFLGLSILTTRRSLARRRLKLDQQKQLFKDNPTSNQEQAQNVSGALEAVEALNIATINVLSVAMTATGAALWYLDVNSLGDARRMIRGGLGVDGKGMTEDEANEEIEEAIASILARKEGKGSAR